MAAHTFTFLYQLYQDVGCEDGAGVFDVAEI